MHGLGAMQKANLGWAAKVRRVIAGHAPRRAADIGNWPLLSRLRWRHGLRLGSEERLNCLLVIQCLLPRQLCRNRLLPFLLRPPRLILPPADPQQRRQNGQQDQQRAESVAHNQSLPVSTDRGVAFSRAR